MDLAGMALPVPIHNLVKGSVINSRHPKCFHTNYQAYRRGLWQHYKFIGLGENSRGCIVYFPVPRQDIISRSLLIDLCLNSFLFVLFFYKGFPWWRCCRQLIPIFCSPDHWKNLSWYHRITKLFRLENISQTESNFWPLPTLPPSPELWVPCPLFPWTPPEMATPPPSWATPSNA